MQTDPKIAIFIAAGLVGAFAVLAVMWRLSLARFVVLGMMFLAGIAAPFDRTTGDFFYRTWLLPLQTQRASLYLAFGCILVIAAMVHYQRCTFRAVGGQSWILLAIGLYSGLLWMVHEPIMEGVQTVLFMAATVGPLTIVIPGLLRERRDWDSLLGVVVLMNVLSIGAVCVQFMVNRDLLMLGTGRRFTGMLANPQHAAVLYAICSMIVLSVLLNTKVYRYWLILIGILGINLIFIAWSGSRTGTAMFIIGATILLYRRLGRGILLLPVTALTLWGVYTLTGVLGIELGVERLVSGEDTRTVVWAGLWEQGMDNLLLGAGISERLDSENSFLTGFATYGLGMLLLLVALVIVAVAHCWKLFRIGLAMPRWSQFTDLVLAFNAMFFAGAVFEGYIIARMNFPFLMMLVVTGIGSKIIYLARAGQLPYLADEYHYDEFEPDAARYDDSFGAELA